MKLLIFETINESGGVCSLDRFTDRILIKKWRKK